MKQPIATRRRMMRLTAVGRMALACAVLATRRAAATPQSAPGLLMHVLSGRHIVQTVLAFRRPCGVVVCWGGLADLAHAATMLLAARNPRWHRLAIADSVTEAALGALSIHIGRRSFNRPRRRGTT